MDLKINWEAVGVLVAVISGAVAVGAWVQVTQSTAVKLSGDIADIRQRSEKIEKTVSHIKLECVSINTKGQVAVCPESYLVAGCSAGQNKGSISHEDHVCRTPDTVDWTEARCCRVNKE